MIWSHPKHSLSHTDGSSDPGSRAESAGSGPICLRGLFPSADPEQYPNPLMPGFPWSSIPIVNSSQRANGSQVDMPQFPSLWEQGPSMEMWAGLEVGKMGSILHNILGSGVWAHGPGRLLSTLDTFIFPESNSASGRARSRRGLFGTWKLESNQRVRSQGSSFVGCWKMGTDLIFAVLTAQGPHLPAWLPCLSAM